MRRWKPLLAAAVLGLTGTGTAAAAWSAASSGSSGAGAGTLLPASGLSISASCTPTSDGTISFVGASSAWGNATPLTVAPPAGLAVGDLLLAQAGHRFSTTLSASGWTVLEHRTNGLTQAVFHRYVTDPSASYSFTAATTGNWAVTLVAYRGVDKVVPVSVSGGTVTGVQATGGQIGSNTTTLTAPSLTTTSANTRLVGFYGAQPKTSLGSPSPSGTVRAFVETDGAGSKDHHVAIAAADRPVSATGATGTSSVTAGSSTSYVAQVVALKPESFPEATVSWTGSATPWTTGYQLQRLLGGSLQRDVSTSASPVLDTPLQAGNTYDYRLWARASGWRSTVVTAQHTTAPC